MRNAAGLTLITASIFLAVVALILNSPALFYMGTALVATIIAAKVQARLAVRSLAIERISPLSAEVGETVTISLRVQSDRRLARPLVFLQDRLPKPMRAELVERAIPISPSYGRPIGAEYKFRPLRRGRFTWDAISVMGTDALGLSGSTKEYKVAPTSLRVYPAPIPFDAPITFGGGIGIEGDSKSRYAHSGVDIRGIRGYEKGDPLKHIHWKSTAKTGNLMVKQFDADTTLRAAIIIQDTRGTEFGKAGVTTLEASCGHALYLVERLLSAGALVRLPAYEAYEQTARMTIEKRVSDVREILADIQATRAETVSMALLEAMADPVGFGQYYIFLSAVDPQLPTLISRLEPGRVTILLEKPEDYVPDPDPRQSASNSAFLDQLEAAGAMIFALPKVVIQ